MFLNRSLIISYRVISHEIEPDRSVLEDYIQTGRKISSSVDILSRADCYETLWT